MTESIDLCETTRVQQAIHTYSVLNDITMNETLAFLSRREELSIVLDLLGLSAFETGASSVNPRVRGALIDLFRQRGFVVEKWNSKRKTMNAPLKNMSLR